MLIVDNTVNNVSTHGVSYNVNEDVYSIFHQSEQLQ